MAYLGEELSLVRYGIPLKLKHKNTGNVLHSHKIAYGTGSRQQEVTAFNGRDDNDWWIIKGPHHGSRINAPVGTGIKNHSIVRLEHVSTGKNLHSSSEHRSPSSGQGEVSAFGDYGYGDDNDNWKLEIEGKGDEEYFYSGDTFKLFHVNTNHTLHSHLNHFTTESYQQEVTAYEHTDDNDFWILEIPE
jgi:dolichyl-phosphate-mannose--protein O-mannosyl transferase